MKQGQVLCLTVLMVLFISSGFAAGKELHVGPTGQYASLSAAVDGAEPGDVIYVAAGCYAEPSENYPIEIGVPITVIGEPGTVLKGALFKPILQVTAADVEIQNIEFQLLRWAVVCTGDRMSLTACRFVLADETQRVSSCGVWLAGVYECAITDSDFFGCGLCLAGPPLSEQSKGLPVLTGLFEVGEDTAYFTSHFLLNNRVNGKPLYFFRNQDNVTVPPDAGGVIAVGCSNVAVEGIDASDSSMGIQLIHCQDVRINNVTVDRCGIFGLYLAYTQRGIITNVSCAESNHGIDLRAVQNLVVSKCVVTDCEQGIFLSFAKDSLIADCQIAGCGNGFFIAAGESNQLANSQVEANGNGVYSQGERDFLITGNSLTENKTAGLRFLRSSGQVIGNEFQTNWVGALAAESSPFTLSHNTFVANACTALYLRDISAGKISFNRFADFGRTSLELDGYVADTLIVSNTFQGERSDLQISLPESVLFLLNEWE